MVTMPKMPATRKVRASRECACGCGRLTKGTWFPGDDGRATGWAIRVEKGLLALIDVPSNERKGCVILLKRRGTFDAAIANGNPRQQAA